jgi:signal transduction histidine kinase
MKAYAGMPLWSVAFCMLILAGLLWGLYRLRLRQVAREFEQALDARAAERTRIARDLHDTLLGSFNGLLLHLEAASILFQTRPDEAKQTLDSTIARAARAINEGREAVQGLRNSVAEPNDLAEAIGRLAEEIFPAWARPEPGAGSEPLPIAFRFVAEGPRRHLHPIVRGEVYRIAKEALRNAFQHSHGTRIEVELRYRVRQFRLRIRDDGQGIDPQILASGGREGHFGLRGMHERAELVGGRLGVWSARGAGTELELTIPGARAYTGTTNVVSAGRPMGPKIRSTPS